MAGMVWACIALAPPLLILLSLQLLRFHFSLDLQTPAAFKGALAVSFLWIRREFTWDGGSALASGGGIHGDASQAGVRNGVAGASPSPPEAAATGTRQRGGLSLPDSWLAFFARIKRRARAASIKWALDFRVWGILLRFTLASGKRMLGLLHPVLEYLQLGIEDVYTLGRIASLWSGLRGAIPALACPTEFLFAAKSFTLRTRLGGRFTGLQALWLGLATVFSFPWVPLASRFLISWRDPRLNRWQRRVLLP